MIDFKVLEQPASKWTRAALVTAEAQIVFKPDDVRFKCHACLAGGKWGGGVLYVYGHPRWEKSVFGKDFEARQR